MLEQLQITHFRTDAAVSKPELAAFLRVQYPAAKPTTINWHIHNLLQQGVLTRLGRGQYRIAGSTGLPSILFRPTLPEELNLLAAAIQAEFPYLTTCLWSTQAVQPYLMHTPFVQYWLLEVERDAVGAVLAFTQLFFVKNEVRSAVPVVRASDLHRMELYLADVPVVVVIKPLISEAPLQRVGEVMTITAEKMIVDLLADDTLFFVYQEELARIVQEITSRYVFNVDRVRRYARRRNHLPQLNELLAKATAQLAA